MRAVSLPGQVLLSVVVVAGFFFSSAGNASDNMGYVAGHLHIVSLKPVEPADADVPAVTPGMYAEYPLVVLTQNEKTEVTHVAADAEGNYRIALPPGNYVLDIQNRVRKHVRAKPVRFTVTSGQTTRVDMEMDTGIR